MKSEKEIVDALKTIQEVCGTSIDCIQCPLVDYSGTCGVQNLEPANWKINNPGKVWRALL